MGMSCFLPHFFRPTNFHNITSSTGTKLTETVHHIDVERLMELVKKRDKKAIEQLYDMFSPTLYGIILKIVGVEERAQDVLQDVFVKIWKNAEKYKKEKGRPFTWMLNIARNASIDSIRRNSNKDALTDDISTVSAQKAGSSEIEIDGIGINKFVDQLDVEYREVIYLAYYQGYTQVEIADELGIPIGTVKSRVRIGIRELRKMVN